jgi:ABC-type transporter Mla subunit MlaD
VIDPLAVPRRLRYSYGMPKEQLKETLRSLAQQIEDANDIAPDVEQRLKDAVDEIHEALAGKPPEGALESLKSALSDAADDFEDSHPTLASTLGRLGDLLSRVGL